MKARETVQIAMFTALTALGALISIPTPSMPVTLQTMMVFLSGIFLGPKGGATAQAVYMFLGLAGLPVFSNMQGGLGFILRPSFGFIIGFIGCAFVVGRLTQSRPVSWRSMATACIAGTIVIYGAGLPYMYFVYNVIMGMGKTASWVLWSGMLIYLPGEAVKISAAVFLGITLSKRLKGFR